MKYPFVFVDESGISENKDYNRLKKLLEIDH